MVDPARDATARLSSFALRGGALACACAAALYNDLLPLPGEWCPPISSPVHLHVAAIGENASSAREMTLHPHWLPWRDALGTELLQVLGKAAASGIAWDRYGNPVRCAASIGGEDGLVYAAPTGQHWQWSPEWIGYTRTLELPSDGELVARIEREYPGAFAPFYMLAPAAQADDERAAREEEERRTHGAPTAAGADDADASGDLGGGGAPQVSPTLTTLSASPPLFRASGLFSGAELDRLHAAARPAFEPWQVGVEGAKEGESSRKHDPRRSSRESWLHGYNDPRATRLEARVVQRRLAALLRLPFVALTRGVEPLLVVEYEQGAWKGRRDGEPKGSRNGYTTGVTPR